MESVLFEIDRRKKGGQALYELLLTSAYATLIKQKSKKTKNKEYNFDDLNESTKKAFADADMRKTSKANDIEDLFEQLGI